MSDNSWCNEPQSMAIQQHGRRHTITHLQSREVRRTLVTSCWTASLRPCEGDSEKKKEQSHENKTVDAVMLRLQALKSRYLQRDYVPLCKIICFMQTKAARKTNWTRGQGVKRSTRAESDGWRWMTTSRSLWLNISTRTVQPGAARGSDPTDLMSFMIVMKRDEIDLIWPLKDQQGAAEGAVLAALTPPQLHSGKLHFWLFPVAQFSCCHSGVFQPRPDTEIIQHWQNWGRFAVSVPFVWTICARGHLLAGILSLCDTPEELHGLRNARRDPI